MSECDVRYRITKHLWPDDINPAAPFQHVLHLSCTQFCHQSCRNGAIIKSLCEAKVTFWISLFICCIWHANIHWATWWWKNMSHVTGLKACDWTVAYLWPHACQGWPGILPSHNPFLWCPLSLRQPFHSAWVGLCGRERITWNHRPLFSIFL